MTTPAAEAYLQAAANSATGSAELRHHLAGELRARVEAAGEANDVPLARATQRLERGGKTRKLRRAAWFAAVAILSLAGLSDPVRQGFRDHVGGLALFKAILGNFSLTDSKDCGYVRELDPQKQLLFPDILQDNPADPELYRPLWQSRPDSSIYYLIYANDYRAKLGALPPDYLETATRLDPDDGFPYLVAADQAAKKALPASVRSGVPGTILSRPDFEEGLRMLHLASVHPRVESPKQALRAARQAALPNAQDLLGEFSVEMLSLPGFENVTLRTGRLAETAAVESEAISEGGLYALTSRDWWLLMPRLIQGADYNSIDLALSVLSFKRPLPAFISAARTFEFSQEEERYRTLKTGLEALRERQRLNPGDPRASVLAQHGSVETESLFAGFTDVSQEEMAAGRKVEHAFFQRALMLVLATIFLVVLMVTVSFRFRGGALSRALARQGTGALSGKSQALACAAAIAPLLALELYLWFGPSAATAWSLAHGGSILTVCLALGALLLSVLLPVAALRRGLRREAGFLHLVEGSSRWLWRTIAATGLALLLLAALPWLPGFDQLFSLADGLGWGKLKEIHIHGPIRIPLWSAAALALPALLLIPILSLRALLSSGEKLPGRLAVASGLLKPYACALCLTALMQPALHAVERHFFRIDPLRQPGQSLEEQAARNYAAAIQDLLNRSEEAAK